MIILDNINLKINKQVLIQDGKITLSAGNVYAVIGESGSGKTTLLHEISLLSKISQSSYLWDDRRIDLLTHEEKADIRRLEIGYVMQDLELISDKLTLKENIQCMSALTNQIYNEECVLKYMQELNLNVSLNDSVEKMSRGERQRFALVLALIKDAKLFICDEPTSALDEENAKEFMEKLKYIARLYNKIIVIATHDHLVKDYADCIYKIKDRHLVIEKNKCIKKEVSIVNNVIFPVDKSFYNIYKKGYRSVQKSIMNIAYILLISLLCLAPFVLDELLEKNKDVYDLMASHEIIMKQDYGDIFDESDIGLLQEIEHIEDIYIYYELDGYIHINGEIVSVRVVPKTDIDQYVISSTLVKNVENNFEVNIEFNYENCILCVDNYIVKDYVQNNSSDIEIVYIPITLWNSLLEQIGMTQSHMLLLVCDEIKNIDNVISEVNRWMPAVYASSSTNEYMEHIKMLEDIREYIVFLQVTVTGVTCVIAYISNYLENKARIKEITNLRINGLNKKHFYTLYMHENKMLVLYVFGLVVISYIFINYNYGNNMVLLDGLLLIIQIAGYLIITKGLTVYIIIRKTFEKDVSVYLRSRF